MNSVAQSKKQDASKELRLPQDFKAKTNVAAGTVRISRKRRSIEIPLGAYASVANVLAIFTEGGRLNELPDEATLKLVDEFTGGSATFRADEIAAVTEAIDTFVAKSPRKRSSQSPKTKPQQTTTSAAAKSSSRNQTDLKVMETKKSEARPVVEDTHWSSMLLPRVTDPDFDMRLVKLAVSPKKAKEVYGLATDKNIPKDAVILPGYDVKTNGRHICWVIVENEKTFHIEKTGFYAGSTHRALEGACARLKFGVVPNAS
ncbi:hypothetical protein [Roseibium sp. RKSG952]|uniref:hypothetical protein n=1 Tax=Roseibium sp. RKSG952 TaxID=2529384 RepID=UPI0012BC9526|nr:hypothetical protein [Roseibium sp. RKSG952]MTH95391.1 hypothetical protein [Roseibium sp. RKSG952]